MTISIQLPGAQGDRLREWAKREGKSEEELTSSILGGVLDALQEKPSASVEQNSDDDLPECWRGYIGVVNSSGKFSARTAESDYGDALWREHQQRKAVR